MRSSLLIGVVALFAFVLPAFSQQQPSQCRDLYAELKIGRLYLENESLKETVFQLQEKLKETKPAEGK